MPLPAVQVSFQQTFEAKRSNHLAELQKKEDDMRAMFVLRVKEKEAELKENEKEVPDRPRPAQTMF